MKPLKAERKGPRASVCVQDFSFLFSKKEKPDISINPKSCLRNAIAYFTEAQGRDLKLHLFRKGFVIHYNSYLFINEHFLVRRPLVAYFLA